MNNIFLYENQKSIGENAILRLEHRIKFFDGGNRDSDDQQKSFTNSFSHEV